MWVVYFRPRDIPGAEYFVRMFYGERMTNDAAPFVDLDAAREAIAVAGGCVQLSRDPNGDPAIVEIWI